jgi:hypothetical protein
MRRAAFASRRPLVSMAPRYSVPGEVARGCGELGGVECQIPRIGRALRRLFRYIAGSVATGRVGKDRCSRQRIAIHCEVAHLLAPAKQTPDQNIPPTRR